MPSSPHSTTIHISGIDPHAPDLARQYQCGYEISAFCYAPNLEDPARRAAVRQELAGISSLWLHAPFAELIPCAVDPNVRANARARFLQTLALSEELGLRRLVFHGGYIPYVYHPDWYVEQSILFWRELLTQVPPDFRLALENVMEPSPELLLAIVRDVDDPRLGLCLDVGHANTALSQMPPEAWLAPMLPYLFHVHLHDNHGNLDEHLPLGAGTIPMDAICSALFSHPNLTITLENQDAAPSLQYLRSRGWL